jgi:methylglutaconyl-CoA hydratase
MQDVLSELKEHVGYITLNRVEKHNAFDDTMLQSLQQQLDDAEANDNVRVIVLKANGPHFSAGADIAWMQRMVQLSETDNQADAMILARVMYTLYASKKPTIAMVQGAAFGGGAGLVAATDIVIAAESARFCFSEVRLGLIPAVISPYVIRAIGERAAAWLFMSAEPIDAERARSLQLVHHCVSEASLLETTTNYARKLSQGAPGAVRLSKQFVREVHGRPINADLQALTAATIAKQRVSAEGQRGMHAFLHKKTPDWS